MLNTAAIIGISPSSNNKLLINNMGVQPYQNLVTYTASTTTLVDVNPNQNNVNFNSKTYTKNNF